MKKAILVLLFLYVGMLFGQETNRVRLSPEATFSLITCGAGEELYASFGHSAFRLKDPVFGYDAVYNYGTFDFETSNFYLKFVQGKLPYQLGRNSFKNFLRTYQYEKRWVKEQVLDLTPEQVRQLFEFLENNYKPENREYKYDFFFNNFATKIRDVIKENFGDEVVFSQEYITEEKTYRNLIHDNLDSNSWSSCGIDIALGAVIDEKAPPIDYQFLPEYVFKAFENATKKNSNTSFVQETNLILEAPKTIKESKTILFSPYVIFSVFLLIVIGITLYDFKNHTRTRLLDAVLLLGNGIVGIVILLLWFATDHTATAMNWNVLWLFPINIFFVRKFAMKSKECKELWRHCAFLLLLIAVVLILWILDYQQFALAAIPLIIMFTIRYAYLTYYFLKLEEKA